MAPPTTLDPRTLLPPGEEMAPESTTDALGRYTALLLRWDVLSRRQAEHDQARATLDAEGAALTAEWADVQEEYGACLEALEDCPLPLAVAIREVWMLAKTYLAQIAEPTPAHRGLLPKTVQEFLSNRTFVPMAETHHRETEG